jgi:Mn2+/Fe2+ NRAMP family transporter
LRRHFPAWLLYFLVGLLVIAKTLTIGADLGAMAAALGLLIHGPTVLYVISLGACSVLLQDFRASADTCPY